MTAEWRFHSTSSCSSLCNLIRLHQAQIAAIWELYALCQVNVLTSCCNSDNKHDISMNKADYSGPVVSPVVIETLDVFTLLTSIQMYSLHSVNFGLLTVWLKCIFTSSETETSENQRVKAGGERSCVPTPYILIIYSILKHVKGLRQCRQPTWPILKCGPRSLMHARVSWWSKRRAGPAGAPVLPAPLGRWSVR